MTRQIMNRRAREYFEVLDNLHAEGYVAHELWQTLTLDQQEANPRMTAKIIEDAMAEAGYSRGSPVEQKKYRLLWLKERGLLPESDNPSPLLEDPIIGAASAIRKQLEAAANERIANEKKKADTLIKEVNEKCDHLTEQLASLEEKHTTVCKERTALQDELKRKDQALIDAIKVKIEIEGDLTKKLNAHELQAKNYAEQIGGMTEKLKNQETKFQQDSAELGKNYGNLVSSLKDFNEKQRHDYIVSIDSYKVANSKLIKEVEHLKSMVDNSEKKNLEANLKIKEQNEKLSLLNATIAKQEQEKSKLHTENTQSHLMLAENKGIIQQLRDLLEQQKLELKTQTQQLLDCQRKLEKQEQKEQNKSDEN